MNELKKVRVLEVADFWIYDRFNKYFSDDVERTLVDKLNETIDAEIEPEDKQILLNCYGRNALSILFKDYFLNNYASWEKRNINYSPVEFTNKLKKDIDFIHVLAELPVLNEENIEKAFVSNYGSLDKFESTYALISSLPIGKQMDEEVLFGESFLYDAMTNVVLEDVKIYMKIVKNEKIRLANEYCPLIVKELLGDLFEE